MAQPTPSFNYCKTTTESHPISVKYKHHVEACNDLLKNEVVKNPPSTFMINHTVLNLDKVEIELKSKSCANREPTCDAMFGISQKGANPKVVKNCKIVLLECKYNVAIKGFDSKFKKDIDRKTAYSKQLISHSIPIHEKTLILVNKLAYQRCRNLINKLLGAKSEVISAEKLAELFP